MEEAKTATEADGAGARNVSSVHGVVAKTVNECALHLVTEALKFCGCQKVILVTDGEHSMETQIITAPRESHASNGAAERAILEVSRPVRKHWLIPCKHGTPKVKMTVSSLQYGWLVRHAGWLLTR